MSPPTDGEQHSPTDGCGWGVFGLKSIVRVFIYRFDVPAGKADEIISEIVENYLVDELVIIGHEPCLSLLISTLTVANPNPDLAISIKKGGACCLSADDLRIQRRAAIEWLLTPKILLKA